MGDTVVLYRPVSVKLGGLACFHIPVQAALPYRAPLSEGLAVALGFQEPQVVYDSDGTRDAKDCEGGAYVFVAVGAATEVAVLTVSLSVKLKLLKL